MGQKLAEIGFLGRFKVQIIIKSALFRTK